MNKAEKRVREIADNIILADMTTLCGALKVAIKLLDERDLEIERLKTNVNNLANCIVH